MNLNRNGIIGTTAFHLAILIILIFFGFSFPDPPPEEEGILVNFGTDETGFGPVEPAGDPVQGGNDPVQVEDQGEDILPVTESVPATTPPTAASNPVEEAQDFEESPVKENKPTPEKIRRAEQERQRQAELERQRQAELEKQRQEEERRRQAARLQQMGESAFGNKGTGNTEGSEGITQGSGNQGSIAGDPNSDNYQQGGGLGNGISYGLGDRKVRGTLPEPLLTGCVVSSRIEIQVRIDVDSEGNIVGDPSVMNATYQDQCIYDAVLRAARSAKFSKSDNFRQRGWIKYIIEP